MSKIEEIRSQVLSETDTAQLSLETFLDTLDSTHVTELRFDISFHGDLDFSILEDRGFKKVDAIVFEHEGEITNLFNLPERITQLSLTNQLVVGFDKLPANMEILNLSDNHISKFDASMVPKLHTLHISNNELTELVNLPDKLEILECENNQLRRLDLAGTPKLKTLICSNNPILVLEHVPVSLVDLQMENNPFIDVDRSTPNAKQGKRTDKLFDYRESLNEYFRLKTAYETKERHIKRAAFEKGATKREGRHKARSAKIPCFNCNQKGGTKFDYTDRHYTATCGNKLKPCKLYINLFSGDYLELDGLLDIYREDIQDEKQSMIEQKMNTLFKYISEEVSAKIYVKKVEQYNETSKMYKHNLDTYEKIYNNPIRIQQIEKKTEGIYRIREDIDKLLDEYKKSGNREILIGAMVMYTNDLIPTVKNMRLIKYDNVFMETISDDPSVTKMVSNEVSIVRNDIIVGQDPMVVKFIVDQ